MECRPQATKTKQDTTGSRTKEGNMAAAGSDLRIEGECRETTMGLGSLPVDNDNEDNDEDCELHKPSITSTSRKKEERECVTNQL